MFNIFYFGLVAIGSEYWDNGYIARSIFVSGWRPWQCDMIVIPAWQNQTSLQWDLAHWGTKMNRTGDTVEVA